MKFCCATANVWINAVIVLYNMSVLGENNKRIFIPGAFIPTVLWMCEEREECVKYFYFWKS